MTQTILGLLRHGQTDWNIDGRLQGTSDIPLNETGRDQAREACLKLNASDWDLVISSPLSRAQETARLVMQGHGLGELNVEPLLMERAFGEAEGWTYHQWRERHTPHIALRGEETLEALEERASKLLVEVAAKYRGKRVLAVSHGALIRKVLRLVSDKQIPADGERIGNTALSLLEHTANGWAVKSFDGRPLGERF